MPREITRLPIAGAPETTKVRYVIDPKVKHVRCARLCDWDCFRHSVTTRRSPFRTSKAKCSSLPDALEEASVRLVIRAASLTVTDDISAKDRQEIERRMHDEVLETDGFEEIVYECNRVSPIQKISEGLYAVTLNGELSLHG